MKSIDEMLDAVAKNLRTTSPEEQIHTKTGSLAPEYDALTLTFAKEIAYTVEKAAETMGISVVTAVVNAGANLMLLHAMDDSFIASVGAARDKAYTAAALKMPTDAALKESRGGTLDGLTNGNGLLLLGGGEPLMSGGKLMGAVGVSGGTKEQDMLLSRLGGEYFRARIK